VRCSSERFQVDKFASCRLYDAGVGDGTAEKIRWAVSERAVSYRASGDEAAGL